MPVATRLSILIGSLEESRPREVVSLPQTKPVTPPVPKLRDPVLAELWLEIDELTSIQGSTYGIVKKKEILKTSHG